MKTAIFLGTMLLATLSFSSFANESIECKTAKQKDGQYSDKLQAVATITGSSPRISLLNASTLSVTMIGPMTVTGISADEESAKINLVGDVGGKALGVLLVDRSIGAAQRQGKFKGTLVVTLDSNNGSMVYNLDCKTKAE